MKKILGGFILFLLAATTFATFNSITDGDPGLAAPIMQNFRHVNFGSVLKPVDTNGVNSSATLDLGTNTVLWKDLYLSGTANVGAGKFSGNLTVDTNTLFVDATNNRVGIGTTTPATALNVLGNIQTQAGASVGADIFTGLNTTLNINTAGASDAITFSQSGNTRMIITGGFLGVGTTTPTTALDVVGEGKFSSNLTVDTNTLYVDATNHMVGIGTISPSTTLDVVGAGKFSGDLAVDTNTLYIDATNNRVGIGTTTPATALNVLGNIQTQAGASVGADIFTGLNATLNIKTAGASDAITFSQAGNTRMIITGGFLGVGTTTPTTALDVVGEGKFSSNLTVDTNTLYADATTHMVGIGTTTPTTLLDVVGASKFSGNLAVDTNTLFVDATNNRVGIGTTTPATALNILGNIQTQAGASVGADIFTGLNATLNIKTAGASDAITFSQSGNTRMIITGGFLGVGTTTPTTALDVVGEGVFSGKVTANGGIDIGGTGTTLKCNVINMGDWNMDATDHISIAHGLTFANIRSATAFIRGDVGTTFFDLLPADSGDGGMGGYVYCDTTNVEVYRGNAGFFDNTGFDSTPFNRGHIMIWYVP